MGGSVDEALHREAGAGLVGSGVLVFNHRVRTRTRRLGRGDGEGRRWPPFPIAADRFDQKNEMFKRGLWDPEAVTLTDRFQELVYQERPGYDKLAYSLQSAAWNTEDAFGYEEATGSPLALYSWTPQEGRPRQCAVTGRPVREDPERMSRVVKKAARLYGADLVGITRVHESWVYSHSYNKFSRRHEPLELPEGCTTAVVMAWAMDFDAIRTSPTAVAGAGTGVGYSRMAFSANLLATFIRALGYTAVPCGNDTALSIPLAMAAGLGETSRMGLLITEKYGPRVRLAKVFTDLPLLSDSYRPFGVTEFCRVCMTCARHCPSQAISEGEMTTEGPNLSSHHGPLKWYVDGFKCYSYWARNRMDCSVCIRVCPFNKKEGRLHDAVRAAIRYAPAFNPLIVRGDQALGYEKALRVREFFEDSPVTRSNGATMVPAKNQITSHPR